MKDKDKISEDMQKKLDRIKGILPPLPQSDYVKERMDRIRGVLPPLPLSDYVEERLGRLRSICVQQRND